MTDDIPGDILYQIANSQGVQEWASILVSETEK